MTNKSMKRGAHLCQVITFFPYDSESHDLTVSCDLKRVIRSRYLTSFGQILTYDNPPTHFILYQYPRPNSVTTAACFITLCSVVPQQLFLTVGMHALCCFFLHIYTSRKSLIYSMLFLYHWPTNIIFFLYSWTSITMQ